MERERELCPAFLIEEFESAARDAAEAVERLHAIASNRPSIDLTELAEWQQAQLAIQRQFRARAALEQTGLPLPADALAAAERAQGDFGRLGSRRRPSE